ncbi:endolytic transglycosylase MltG [Clostridium estertheticum]|uniref:endolytic transglycosylase MltG n=1 Tax=Clostridium estertheticum TaxID=238834 RepID=UPI001C0B500F|nr:endolytic transglycosylase MltG [Clostridium estertheticum]MBU3076162.1 endolytic transglycosylase MltG [Clostridium estertheticum]MBU3166253.1 endolytic transglycosylase MltG [Clostridium estertheticum]
MNLKIMKFRMKFLVLIVFIIAAFGILNVGNILYKKTNVVKVTVPEGYTYEEIGKTLQKSGLVTQKDFIKEVENWSDNNYWFLKDVPNDKHKLDGFLFPATYSFQKNATSKVIIKKMLDTFEFNMKSNKDYITKNKLNIRNVVIEASLVEKEAGKDVDRTKIASVIKNRLKKKMPLQIDATIIYIVGDKKKLYNKDLAVKSPYNTYLNKGLPPSPICNPGIKSINAAVHPEKTNYIFYVLNNKTDEHVFSITYAEHIKNVAKYIK